MGNVGTETPSHDHMPSWSVFFIKFFFYVTGDISLNVVSVQGLVGYINGLLLHLIGHIGILNDGFSLRHIIIIINYLFFLEMI
jgi:hypothetical protein